MTEQTGGGGRGFSPIIADFLERPDEMRRRVSDDAGAVERAFAELADAAIATPRAVFDASNLAAAVITSDLELVTATPAFRMCDAARQMDLGAVRKALHHRRAVIAPASVVIEGQERPALFIYGSGRTIQFWNLPLELATAAGRPDHVLVLTSFVTERASLERACRTYGLTGLQARIVISVVASGNIREAAVEAGVSYATAREAISAALKRSGSRRLPALIAKISLLALGVLPPQVDIEELLVDHWHLTKRQAALAIGIAEGFTREQIAHSAGISVASVKKELGIVYATLEVTSAASLSRLVSEFRAIAALTSANGEILGYLDPITEPLTITHRADGSSIGWSDYPGKRGIPVLYVHSSMSTRIAPRPLVREVQARGRRLIAIDRPGFGMSDPIAGIGSDRHFAAAAADCLELLDRIGVDRIDVVARSATQFVMHLERSRPGLIRAAVLVNPDPPSSLDPRRTGPLGAFKEYYLRRPWLVRAAAKVIAGNLSRSRFRRVMEASMKGSPPDEEAICDEAVLNDHFRSVRPFATGRLEGYVAEQIAFATMTADEPLAGTSRWCVLLGEYDTLHDPAAAAAYWRAVLPDAQLEFVPDAGRLLMATHTATVAARLDQLAEN